MRKNFIIGIYCIKCLQNNKIYAGATIDFRRRVSGHRHNLNKHSVNANRYLQEDWDKYGEHNFVFIVVERCDPEILFEREKCWIEFYKNNNCEMYNLTNGGMGSEGWDMPEETKRKIGYKSKNHKFTKSQTDKISKSNIGLKKKTDANKYIGICFLQDERYWSVKINTGKKRTYIGYSKYEVEAAMMYNDAMLEYYGWKANDKLNIITQEEIDNLWNME